MTFFLLMLKLDYFIKYNYACSFFVALISKHLIFISDEKVN